jgi:transposase
VNIREIINAIFDILSSGGAWRLMPHDLPHKAYSLLLLSMLADCRSLAAVEPSFPGKSAPTTWSRVNGDRCHH